MTPTLRNPKRCRLNLGSHRGFFVTQQVPAAGDLLISKRADDGKFEISIVPGRPQFVIPHQQDAIQHAHAFASKNGASVWITDSNGNIVRVERPSKRRES